MAKTVQVGKILVHVHDGFDQKSFNYGVATNVAALSREARLPAVPTSSDIQKARDILNRVKSNIDGLMVYLR